MTGKRKRHDRGSWVAQSNARQDCKKPRTQGALKGSNGERGPVQAAGSKHTAVKPKVCAATAVHNITTDDKARAARRREDAELIRVEDAFENVAGVLTLAEPHDSGANTAAKHAAARIAAEMEKDLKVGTAASDTELKMLTLDDLRARLSRADNSASDDNLALLARQWTHNFRSFMEHSNGRKSGPNMYPLVTAFILYVQRQIKRLRMPAAAQQAGTRASQMQQRQLDVSRLLLPSEGNDFKPKGFDELERIDFALQLCDVDAAVKAQTETHTRDIFAVVECKTKPDQKDKALDQLIQYTRNLYRVQYNCRFAWGLSVCGVDVRAVVMLHDAVLVSPVMSVATLSGRRRLVELLVNWAVCDDVQAGYDPTVVFDPATRHYRIQCPDDGGDTVWYRTTEYILPADNLIGRHTRCFVAERENEDGKDSGPNDVVVIKDAFAVAAPLSAGDDGHNEIQLLHKIRETFVGDESVDFLYPELVRGGDVKLRVGASEMDNNTDAIFSLMGATRQDKPEPSNSGDQPKCKWLEQPYRVHRRLVMRPKGGRLSTAGTEAEIAIALAEAMRCHTAIHQRCRILHRDISLNNILVVYGPDGVPWGLLIDFDYAIPLDNIHTSRRPGRSGMLAYMSIGNLEHTGQRQTALDDWESLLYTLCMWGTLSLESGQAADGKRDIAKLPIGLWTVSSHEEIAHAKHIHMHMADIFEGSILDNFHESCRGLKSIAQELHAALFLHKGCTGALSNKQQIGSPTNRRRVPFKKSRDKQPIVYHTEDPLVMRRTHEDAIVESLTAVMAEYSRKATEVWQDNNAKEPPAAGPINSPRMMSPTQELAPRDWPQTPTPAPKRKSTRKR